MDIRRYPQKYNITSFINYKRKMFNACQPDCHRVRVDTLLAVVLHTLVYIIMQNILCQPLFFTFYLLLPVFCHLLFAILRFAPLSANCPIR